MKHLFLITITVVLFLVDTLAAQKATTFTETQSSKKSSYSYVLNTGNVKDRVFVSIRNNDNIYKFYADFHNSKVTILKQLLEDKLGKPNFTKRNSTYVWKKITNGNKLYDCKLTDDALKIYLNKEFASAKTIKMIDEFGLDVKNAISDSKSEK